MTAPPWFRMYSEFMGDPVVQSLAFEDQRHYVMLLCMKCSGLLDRKVDPKVRDRMIARGLGLDLVAADEAKRRLVETGLCNGQWQPSSWNARQYKSDNSTERVRKYRKKKKSGNESETFQNRSGNAPETEQNRAEKIPPVAPPSRSPVGSRLNPDWTLPDAWRSWAVTEEHMNTAEVVREAEKFADYWHGVPGAKGRKTDWQATWRNWCRNRRGANGKAPEPDPYGMTA